MTAGLANAMARAEEVDPDAVMFRARQAAGWASTQGGVPESVRQLFETDVAALAAAVKVLRGRLAVVDDELDGARNQEAFYKTECRILRNTEAWDVTAAQAKAEELEQQREQVLALCAEVRTAASIGCLCRCGCVADGHCETHDFGCWRPVGWTLDPDAVRSIYGKERT